MTKVIPQRVTAQIEGDFVVFLIGMRINKPWKFHKWLPVFLAMPKMLKELERRPEPGVLGAIFGPSTATKAGDPQAIPPGNARRDGHAPVPGRRWSPRG